MLSRPWASDTLLSRFKILVQLIVAFHNEDESGKKTKNQPEFNKLGMALEDGVKFLFSKEMPEGAEQIAGNISSAILTLLRLLGENKIGGEQNANFILTLIDAMHELGSFRKACESEIAQLDAKKRGYGLILMTENKLLDKLLNKTAEKNPILAWSEPGNYNLYGYHDGIWQLTIIDRKRVSHADKHELSEARDVGPGVIFVKPQTSLFNVLMTGHSKQKIKETEKKGDCELELMNVVAESEPIIVEEDIDDKKYDYKNKDILLIELDSEKFDHLKEELLEKIRSLSVKQEQVVTCVSFFKHAASYYPKAFTTGCALNSFGLSFAILYFLGKYLGDTLDALIQKDKTGINHEAMLAILFLLSGTIIVGVTLIRSINCHAIQESIEEDSVEDDRRGLLRI